MTVDELIKALRKCDPDAVVAFAECDHHWLDVADPTQVIDEQHDDQPIVLLYSPGWSDDCDCEDD